MSIRVFGACLLSLLSTPMLILGQSALCQSPQCGTLQTYAPHRSTITPLLLRDEPVVIDYLFVLDRTATAYAQAHGGNQALANEALRTLNASMANSGINLRFRLVGTMTLDYTMSTLHEGLQYALSNADIARRRRELKADIVTLCGAPFNNGTTGVAIQQARRGVAYSAVLASAVSEFVVAHEVAHIFGCQHSREHEGDAGNHAYAVGTARRPYYTIMGIYNDALGANTLAPVFSGPETVWQGVRLGSPTEDNVRMLRERMQEVSTFGDYLEPQYYLSQHEWLANNEAQELRLTIRTSEFFELRSSADWVSFTPNYGLDDVEVILRLSANSGEERVAKVRVSGTDHYRAEELVIRQSGNASLPTMVGEVTPERHPFRLASTPSVGKLYYSGNEQLQGLELFNLTGMRVWYQEGSLDREWDFGSLPPGVYLLKAYCPSGIYIQKLNIH